MSDTKTSPYDPYQSSQNTTDQWLRRWALVLTGAGGQTVLSEDAPAIPPSPGVYDGLRITFRTTQNRSRTPGRAVITVFNPRMDTPIKDLAKQYNRAVLFAGYQKGYYGVIFDGAIAYLFRGRESNLVDTFLQIHAIAGDWALNGTKVNATLAAGRSAKDVATLVSQEMAKNGVTVGQVDGVSETKMPRGQVIYGMGTDALQNVGAAHFVEHNTLKIYDPKKPIGNEVFDINAKSGMVGMPRVTADGVEVTTLINAAYKLHGRIHINEADINQVAGNPNLQGGGSAPGFQSVNQGFNIGYFADVTADGYYTIYSIEYEGDSRGNPWYAHLICNGQNLPPGSVNITNPAQDTSIDPGIGPTSGQIGTYGTAPGQAGSSSTSSSQSGSSGTATGQGG